MAKMRREAAPPYSIGSATVPGLSKLVEELGELLQVLGKLMGAGGLEHWQGNLHDSLVAELGDAHAALEFFEKYSIPPSALRDIGRRQTEKFLQFEAWHREYTS